MAKNKMNRGGFLKMLSTMSIAPLVAKLPFVGGNEPVVEQIPSTLEPTELTPLYGESYYNIPTYGSQNDTVGKAGEPILKGSVVYLNDDGMIYKVDARIVKSPNIVGIAAENKETGEYIKVLPKWHFIL